MKRITILTVAALVLFAAIYGYSATIRDSMTFKGPVTFSKTATVTQPKMTYGYTIHNYTSASGAAYTVADSIASPTVFKITGGSGNTTFVMTYSGAAAANAGKMFYVINSSSNTVTFKQSGATGINVATLKIVTVIGNGTDFERITADQ